jgi:hypothetical protein
MEKERGEKERGELIEGRRRHGTPQLFFIPPFWTHKFRETASCPHFFFSKEREEALLIGRVQQILLTGQVGKKEKERLTSSIANVSVFVGISQPG